jgi:predicted dehydrogenase
MQGTASTSVTGSSPRVAIVGCGAVVQNYYAPALRVLERSGRLEVAVVFDPDPSMRSRVKRSFASAVEASEFSELQRIEADLVILTSPPAFHAAQGMESLRQGRSVLCEKPLAASSRDARALVDAAAGGSAVLAAGMIRRFFPATQTIRDLVAAGVLGDIVSIEVQEGNLFRWPAASPAYFSKRSGAGGVLMDIGTHALDLLIWWLGEPTAVEYEDDSMGGIEANCRVRCRFAGEVAGEVRLSRDCELANRYVLRGTRGELAWRLEDVNRLELRVGGSRYTLNSQLEEERQPAAHFERCFIDQILNVLAAMRGAEPLRVPAADALPSLRVIDRCYARRSLMAMGWLGPEEAARAARLHGESE